MGDFLRVMGSINVMVHPLLKNDTLLRGISPSCGSRFFVCHADRGGGVCVWGGGGGWCANRHHR